MTTIEPDTADETVADGFTPSSGYDRMVAEYGDPFADGAPEPALTGDAHTSGGVEGEAPGPDTPTPDGGDGVALLLPPPGRAPPPTAAPKPRGWGSGDPDEPARRRPCPARSWRRGRAPPPSSCICTAARTVPAKACGAAW